ncbi:hypothetical protein OR1_01601 [Geobacter sp. OR-1]|uniref:hypothetical protein n=1 Tax=Geobacter sp. OR-1 TaxID=1266765 RepID=UPI000542F509|nr:hypothetical protein [Geobacter sp. OR-1]GAM09326.1 hypothetical protein OR1_01601 [Geobacter sp. OR-1]
MKRILALLAATLFTLSLTGLAFAEEPKKDDAAAKEGKAEKKEVKKVKKDAKKDAKKGCREEGRSQACQEEKGSSRLLKMALTDQCRPRKSRGLFFGALLEKSRLI